MRTFQLNKLVRDKIKGYYSTSGNKVTLKKLNKTEFLNALKKKLYEELEELNLESREEILSELADIQELIDSLLETSNLTKSELAEAQKNKNKKNGSFKNKDFIKTISIKDDDEWLPYFAENPGRFPEIKKSRGSK